MPRYDYRCYACRTVWEEDHSIADRDVPVSLPCPECKESGQVEKFLGGAPVWTREGYAKKVPSAFKDILKNMKKNHVRSSINA